MTTSVSHTHIPDFDTQLEFAKRYFEDGFAVIVTALSWHDVDTVSKQMRKHGIASEGAALDALVNRERTFIKDSFVLWCEPNSQHIEAAKPLVEALRDRAEASEYVVRIAQDSPMAPQEVMARQRKMGLQP